MGRRRKGPRILEPIELQTTQLDRDGRALSEHDERTVLVADGLARERLIVQLTGRSRGRDEGRALEVLEANPDRVEPRCLHFGMCGGCRLQHMGADAQVRNKQDWFLADLAQAGVEAGEVLEPLRGPSYGYRRRARMGVKWVDKKDKVLVGFRERDKRYVADLSTCEILAGDAGKLIAPLSEMIKSLRIRSEVPQIEVTVADAVTVLVFRVLAEPGEEDRAVLAQFGREHDVRVYLQPGGLETIAPLEGEPASLHYGLPTHDVELGFLPTDFVQVNAALNRSMIDLALDKLAVTDEDEVLDLFCGLGNFTLPLARCARRVVGVEGDEGLVERARANAERNGIANTEFAVADLYKDPDGAKVWEQRWDLVLLDPPRSGAEAVIERLPALEPRRIVYVACGPAAFIRDAAKLGELGYRLTQVGVMDMFPHTMHIECIGVFEPG